MAPRICCFRFGAGETCCGPGTADYKRGRSMTSSRRTRTELFPCVSTFWIALKTGPGLTSHQAGGPGGTDCDVVHLYKNVDWRAVIPDTAVCDRYHT